MNDYPRECWYAVAWSDELQSQPLGRTVIGQRYVLWRRSDGAAVAMIDRCPHRLAPLSRGRCDGDTLVCGYHGLRFNSRGECVHNPFGERIPAVLRVETLPLVERHSMLWLWTGEPVRADPGLIPDFAFNANGPGNRVIHGYTLVAADIDIATDNLLNLSHIEFLHTGTFAGAGVIFAGQFSARRHDDIVDANWWMPGIPPPPFARGMFSADSKVDHWLDMRWHAPGAMHLQVGVTAAGAPRTDGIVYQQAHILSPAGRGRTHYWWSFARQHDLESAGMDEALRVQLAQAFNEEDKPMLEAIESGLGGERLWDQRPLSLSIDAGAALAHKVVRERLAREAELRSGVVHRDA